MILADGISHPRRVHVGVVTQRQRRGLDDKVVDRKFVCGLAVLVLFGLRVECLAQFEQLVGADVHRKVVVGHRRFGFQQSFCDHLAYSRVLDFGEVLPGHTRRRTRTARATHSARATYSARLNGCHDIRCNHTPVRPSRCCSTQINTSLPRQRTRQRRGKHLRTHCLGGSTTSCRRHPTSRWSRWHWRWRCRGLRSRGHGRRSSCSSSSRRRFGARIVAEGRDISRVVHHHQDYLPDSHLLVTLLDQHLGDDALLLRLPAHGGLVGLNVHDQVAGRDLVARLDFDSSDVSCRHCR
mmetsp:Transcript_13085/g.20729  ORF Transcript_13085/g.20729 Transcript_13085/m.20729 type:complete len:295 (+) Transcript_13085:874-1758(+)